MNNAYPAPLSFYGTPPHFRITWWYSKDKRPHLSEGESGAEAIRLGASEKIQNFLKASFHRLRKRHLFPRGGATGERRKIELENEVELYRNIFQPFYNV